MPYRNSRGLDLKEKSWDDYRVLGNMQQRWQYLRVANGSSRSKLQRRRLGILDDHGLFNVSSTGCFDLQIFCGRSQVSWT